jgi:hypothetical protein
LKAGTDANDGSLCRQPLTGSSWPGGQRLQLAKAFGGGGINADGHRRCLRHPETGDLCVKFFGALAPPSTAKAFSRVRMEVALAQSIAWER